MNTEYSQNELNHENLAEFADLVRGLERMEYHDHPSEEILRAYIAHRLPEGPGAFRDEQAFQGFARGRLSSWTRSDVSMHVLTCAVCQQSVLRLRAGRWRLFSSARQHPREDRSWRRRLALGALASAAAAAVIFALWLTPTCWIEEQCWQQEVMKSSSKGSILIVYRQAGRF